MSVPSAEREDAERSKLKVAFVCAGDPLDVKTWSGTPLNMLTHLRNEFDDIEVMNSPWAWWFTPLRKAVRRTTGGRVDIYWSAYWSRIAALSVVERISASGADVVICVAVSPICAQLVGRCRTVYITDATNALMVSYNPRHKALMPSFKKNAFDMETRCITRSVATFVPSEWARASAIDDHGGSANTVFQVPWGANIVSPDETVATRPASQWNILFVGVTWLEKGGDIALACIEKIRAMGYPVHLDVIGAGPGKIALKSDDTVFHGFIDKGSEPGRKRFEALFRNADILIFPTQFDALGIVTAEAAAFGVPTISYRTGGVPANFIDGVTGILLEIGASADDFAAAIVALLTDRPRYDAMSRAAREFSRSSLNWNAWARRVAKHILAAIPAPVTPDLALSASSTAADISNLASS